jgi:hypothetical protein
MPRQVYTGGCHCRRVRFEVTGILDRATQCNCSICAAKGYLHHMVAPQDFRLLSGADDLVTYTFGTHVAQHLFCKTCGIAPFYRPRLDPSQYMLNLRCMDGLDLTQVRIAKFDGQSWESRPDAPYKGTWGR